MGLLLGINESQAQSIFPDSFNPGVSGGQVTNLAIQADGRILLSGDFTMAGGQFRNGLARLHADGSLDQNFDAQVSGGPVNALAIQADGKIVIVGGFQWVGGQMRFGLARLHANGALDAGFNVEVSGGPVTAVAIQPDGKLVLGGGFNWVGGQFRAGLARLDSNGGLDANFTPSVSGGAVAVLAMQPDGKILVGGSFNSLAGQFRDGIGRLNADGTPDGNFNGSATGGAVQSLALQPDGKILVGGSFTTLNRQSREYFGRLTPEGNLEGQFGAAVSGGQVASLALQADGKILLAGAFTSLGGQTREGLGRLNADGNLDFSFSTSVAGGTVSALALQTDGNILLGGSFSTLSGQTRNGIGRLDNPDIATQSLNYNATSATWLRGGASPEIFLAVFDRSADGLTWVYLGAGTRIAGGWQLAGFNLPAGQTVRSRGYVSPGNWFVEYLRGPEITGQPASLTVSFGQSATFSVSATGLALDYQWWKDGQALPQRTNAVLTLTNLDMSDAGQYSVVVSNAYGSVTSTVATLAVEKVEILNQPASQSRSLGQSVTFTVVVTGSDLRYQWWKDGVALPQRTNASLTLSNLQYSDIAQYYVVITNRYGKAISSIAELTVNPVSVDLAFNPGPERYVHTTVEQPDGKILVGGSFTWLVAGQPQTALGRLNPDGTLDGSFKPALSGASPNRLTTVYALAVQLDGKVLVGGDFTTVNGQPHTNIVRLNPNGSVDPTFSQQADYDVQMLALQPDGKILIGGNFWNLLGSVSHGIDRLNPDGTHDSGFSGSTGGGQVQAVALQPDGRIIVGGWFNWISGEARQSLVRLNADGSLDRNFNTDLGGTTWPRAFALGIQASGKIVVAGEFNTVAGQARTNLVRLNADGSLDPAFTPSTDASVVSMALQADGKIWIGGGFRNVNGEVRTNLARLNADGTLDRNLELQLSSIYISSLYLQGNGRILVGGMFNSVDGHVRPNLARLINTSPGTQTINSSNSTVTWWRGSSSPELQRTTLEYATLDSNWTSLGAGYRTLGGWQWSQVNIPAHAALRVRGSVAGCGSSAYFIELLQRPFSSAPPAILLNDGGFGVAPGRFGFNVQGQPGQVLVMESSSNLLQWSPVLTNTINNNQTRFEDPNWRAQSRRNYRVRLWP